MPTSSMLPTETKCENPIRSRTAQSRIDVPRAPDCEMNAICPAAGIVDAKLALSFTCGAITPRQFGPTIRMPSNSRTVASSFCSRASPAGPVSRKPADRTMTPRIPAAPHSATMSGTESARVQTIARSTSSGKSRTLAKAGRSCTFLCFGLTGNTGLSNPPSIRFRKTVYPTLSAFELAPTTAID
ncbi:MAG: hypothetical protein ACI8P0_001010 [Planctomycetaceae bacterium]|jgi:hypothetical protein